MRGGAKRCGATWKAERAKDGVSWGWECFRSWNAQSERSGRSLPNERDGAKRSERRVASVMALFQSRNPTSTTLSHRGLNSSHLSTLFLQDYMRLCFAWLTEEQLVEGVQHLKDLMEEKSE